MAVDVRERVPAWLEGVSLVVVFVLVRMLRRR